MWVKINAPKRIVAITKYLFFGLSISLKNKKKIVIIRKRETILVYPPQLIISILKAEIAAKKAASKPAFEFFHILLDTRYAGKTIIELKTVAVKTSA